MEYKIMTREELEYMMIDLHVICLMKDEEIKTLKDKNEMLEDRKEYLRKKYNESVLLLEKEKEQLKKQIDELIYENSELGKFNIHMYVREQEKLMRENEQLRRQINDLSDTCSEQLETIATLQKTKNKQAETIKNKDTMTKDLDILISTIKQLDKKLEIVMKDNKAYELRIEELEQKILDEQLDRVVERTKCKTNPPCECDTESKPKFDDSVDCRPRKQ